MLDSYCIIKSILITEKSMLIQKSLDKYTFEVNKSSSKIDIARAIEKIYNVRVKCVHTLNRLGKLKRNSRRSNKYGRTSSKKYAVITLSEGKINVDV